MEHKVPESESDRRKRRRLGLWLILLPVLCLALLYFVEWFRLTPHLDYTEFPDARPVWWKKTLHLLVMVAWLSLPTTVSGVLLYLRRAGRFSVFLASFLAWGFCGTFLAIGVLGNVFATPSEDFALMQGSVLGLGSMATVILASCVFSLEHTGAALIGFFLSPLAIVANISAPPLALAALVSLAFSER